MTKITIPIAKYGIISLLVFFQMNFKLQVSAHTLLVNEKRKPEIRKNNGI